MKDWRRPSTSHRQTTTLAMHALNLLVNALGRFTMTTFKVRYMKRGTSSFKPGCGWTYTLYLDNRAPLTSSFEATATPVRSRHSRRRLPRYRSNQRTPFSSSLGLTTGEASTSYFCGVVIFALAMQGMEGLRSRSQPRERAVGYVGSKMRFFMPPGRNLCFRTPLWSSFVL